jgi:plastocyanin
MDSIRRSVAVALVAATLALAGCGGGSAAPGRTLPAPADPATPKLALTAQNIAFAQAEAGVAANTAFILLLDNRDSVPHNVSLYRDQASGSRAFEGAVVSGPGSRWYAVPALAPGTYVFVCDVHPNMTGRLTAS